MYTRCAVYIVEETLAEKGEHIAPVQPDARLLKMLRSEYKLGRDRCFCASLPSAHFTGREEGRASEEKRNVFTLVAQSGLKV